MNGERQTCNPIFHIISHTRMAAMAIAIAAVLTGPMQGQTFNFVGRKPGTGCLPIGLTDLHWAASA